MESRVTEREKDLQRKARTEEWQRDSVREQVCAVIWLSGWCQGLAVPQSPPTKFGQNWDYSGGRKAWMTSSVLLCFLPHAPPSLPPSLSLLLSLPLLSSLLISLFLSFPPLFSLFFVFLFISRTKQWSLVVRGESHLEAVSCPHPHRNM